MPRVKFQKYNVAELLGITPIALATDAQIWTLITPNVLSLLGEVTEVSKPRVMETQAGVFVQDEATNLNNHKLYDGKEGYVRFPYIVTTFKTLNGAIIIKRDPMKVKVVCWFGNLATGQAEMIYRVSLRDRRFDGTLRANDCPLLDFPYDDEHHNKPLPFGPSCEASLYGFLPGSRLVDSGVEPEYEKFIGNPFAFLGDADRFLHYFNQAWTTRRAPGQVAAPIPDVSQLIEPRLNKLALQTGYDFLENAASHYHVLRWVVARGYRYNNANDAQVLDSLSAGIKRIKESGLFLNRAQESWVCVAQSLPVERIPPHLYIGGATWPQNNLDQKNLWLHKPMHEGAAQMVSGKLPV